MVFNRLNIITINGITIKSLEFNGHLCGYCANFAIFLKTNKLYPCFYCNFITRGKSWILITL